MGGLYCERGIALELLAKSVLANINPILIADPRNEQSLLLLAQGEPRGNTLPSLRTISADTAIDRLKRLGVSFDQFGDDLQALRIARNAIVHAGVFEQTDVDLAFDAWVRSMVELCRRADYKMSTIFGEGKSLVKVQLKQYATATDALWQQRRAAAKKRWQALRSELSSADIDRRSESFEAEMVSANAVDPSVQWVRCEVCDLPARLYGDLELEADFDVGDGQVYVSGVYFEFVPKGLNCPTCQLNLDSRKLVERSGLLKDWELSDWDRMRWEEELTEDWDSGTWPDDW